MASHNVAAVWKRGWLPQCAAFTSRWMRGWCWCWCWFWLRLIIAVLAVVEPDLGPKFWHLGGAFAHLSLFARQTLNLILGRGRSEHNIRDLRI
ncbi:uncharacterized protein K444DRAFT_265621 [Hyaloscypha bicolor E]|uniref:Uncharacterized protein n=1 Tax=Hyaloscypha bicolor E TaxID=1095630 RepID=A0A2J6SHR5_9HELO|nr:uncharacterized protein K444DRAFT_265621 [Hyaloscypha bicolor E]PMD50318.1 hypothetical protein K444DRAFT_265621 [Hyaloscypha bicolor E]